MHNIVSVESTRRPLAIGYKLIRRVPVIMNGHAAVRKEVSTLTAQPQTLGQAVEWARYLQAQGYEFDAGAAQVHSTNFTKYGLTLESAFDPCQSIRAGAMILTDCYARALPKFGDPKPALRAAISCYQSGNFSTGKSTGYVDKVISVAR